MVLLKSEKIEIGSQAPNFQLKSVEGQDYSLESFADAKALVVMFICNHCPYVKAIEDRYIQLYRDYQDKGVQVVGICANDPSDYPDDSPQNLLKRWQEKEYGFPYLIDETQEVAKAYDAVCTPDLYVYDGAQKLAYHGQLDNNWQDASQVTRRDLRLALDALLAGEKPATEQVPAMGCSIKWRS